MQVAVARDLDLEQRAAALKELGADSFDLLELVTALEDEFGMTFQDDAVGSIVTVGQVVAAIEAAK